MAEVNRPILDTTANEDTRLEKTSEVKHTEVKKKKTSDLYRKVLAVTSGFTCICLSDGILNFQSLLFVKLQEEFGKSKAETAVVQSVASGTFYIGGIFAGFIASRFGLLKAGLLGATLEVVGQSASFFSPDIETLVVTLGLINGFGCSLIYVYGNTVTAIPFQGTAKVTAICTASVGTGFGSVLYPYVMEYMSEEYGWRGTLLVLSGVTTHLFVILLLNKLQTHSHVAENNRNVNDRKNTLHILKEVLKDKMFLAFTIGTSLAFGVLIAVLIFQVDYFEEMGYDRMTSISFYTAVTVASAVIRPLPGLLERIPHCGTFGIEACAILFGAVAYSILPLVDSSVPIIILNSMIGLFLGMVGSLFNGGTMKLLDKERFSVGLGLLLTLTGVIITAAGPLAGLIKDSTGSYKWLYHVTGAFFTLCAFLLFSVGFIRKMKYHKSQEKLNEISINIYKNDLLPKCTL